MGLAGAAASSTLVAGGGGGGSGGGGEVEVGGVAFSGNCGSAAVVEEVNELANSCWLPLSALLSSSCVRSIMTGGCLLAGAGEGLGGGEKASSAGLTHPDSTADAVALIGSRWAASTEKEFCRSEDPTWEVAPTFWRLEIVALVGTW